MQESSLHSWTLLVTFLASSQLKLKKTIHYPSTLGYHNAKCHQNHINLQLLAHVSSKDDLLSQRTDRESQLHSTPLPSSKPIVWQSQRSLSSDHLQWVLRRREEYAIWLLRVWTCLTILVGTRSPHKKSKQTEIVSTGDILFVPTRSNAISKGLMLELGLGFGVRS